MSEMKEWLSDLQENGDDGTGFKDYEPLYDNHTEVSQEEWEDMEYERLQRKAH